MSTFDGSTGDGHTPSATLVRPDASGLAADVEPPEPFDPLASLRQAVEERDAATERTTPVMVPGEIGWRLVCAIDFDFKSYQRWQKNALPPAQRNGRRVNLLDLDQAALTTTVLIKTCEEIQYRTSAGEWLTMVDPATEEPLTLVSPSLMTQFGVMDPRLFVKRLFGGDAGVVAAGQEVIDAAGWGEPEAGGEEDPTV